MVIHSATLADMKRQALEEGMSPLRRSGLMKVRDGVTTLDEVVRETM
jgi:type IV pilus assembly protein PilB